MLIKLKFKIYNNNFNKSYYQAQSDGSTVGTTKYSICSCYLPYPTPVVEELGKPNFDYLIPLETTQESLYLYQGVIEEFKDIKDISDKISTHYSADYNKVFHSILEAYNHYGRIQSNTEYSCIGSPRPT